MQSTKLCLKQECQVFRRKVFYKPHLEKHCSKDCSFMRLLPPGLLEKQVDDSVGRQGFTKKPLANDWANMVYVCMRGCWAVAEPNPHKCNLRAGITCLGWLLELPLLSFPIPRPLRCFSSRLSPQTSNPTLPPLIRIYRTMPVTGRKKRARSRKKRKRNASWLGMPPEFF